MAGEQQFPAQCPPEAPSALKIRSEGPLMAYKALSGSPLPCPAHSLVSRDSLTCFAPATLASWPLLKPVTRSPTSGPLHLRVSWI